MRENRSYKRMIIPGKFHVTTRKQIYKHMKRAMRTILLTQVHDYFGEFHPLMY
jgi:hypothetical protein